MSEQANKTETFHEAVEQFVEHQKRAFEASAKAMDALFPELFKEQSKVAHTEFRQGLKVLLDATITELEKLSKVDLHQHAEAGASATVEHNGEASATSGKTKIKVEVE
ncbi:MAG: hypothetical protein ACOYLB_03895 [Phototrophicaceae bacterium]